MSIEKKINQIYIWLGQEDEIFYNFNLNIFFFLIQKKNIP
jgi:hypothetical protein